MEMELSEKESPNQNISTPKVHLQLIQEGKAEVITPSHVFYNPVQEFNRDLSIAVLSVFSKLYSEEIQNTESKISKAKTISRKTSKTTSVEDGTEVEISNHSPGESTTLEAGIFYENGITILEALSATGLRSVRYAKEIPGLKQVVANDVSFNAVESIKSTIAHNHVEHIVKASHEDATLLMYQSRKPNLRFTAIDLDPYGCPGIFLDGAVQAVCEGGLLLVTATDMAVLAGNAPETCYTKYGSVSLRSKACHEMALRILLQCIEAHATRYGRHIVPLLSVSIDFYIRVFVRVYTSPKECKKTTSKLAIVHQCTGCESTILQPLGILKPFVPHKKQTKSSSSVIDENISESKCPVPVNKQIKYALPTGPSVTAECEHCQHRHHTGGPIWIAELHDKKFVSDVLSLCEKEAHRFGTAKRLHGVLSVVGEELSVPLYFTLEKLCSTLHLETLPLMVIRSAILNGGYEVSYSHACKTSIKTNAPTKFIWDILRVWEKDHPVKKERLQPGVPVTNILSKSIDNKINFEMRTDANPDSRKKGCVRYPQNPAPHWGPGTRGTVMIGDGKIAKSIRNQNKKGAKRETTCESPPTKQYKTE